MRNELSHSVTIPLKEYDALINSVKAIKDFDCRDDVAMILTGNYLYGNTQEVYCKGESDLIKDLFDEIKKLRKELYDLQYRIYKAQTGSLRGRKIINKILDDRS